MHKPQHNLQHNHPLFEGLEYGDLARLVHPKLHIDEFQSKMGDDADIIVLSFKADGKEPSKDLMSFIERGYDWILDSDVSSGELEDGEYLVFAELSREPECAKNIVGLIENICNLTKQDIDDWRFQYRKDGTEYPVTAENIAKVVPLTPEAYDSKYGEEEEESELEVDDSEDIEAMQESARVPMNKKAPVNDFTESLRVAAGLK